MTTDPAAARLSSDLPSTRTIDPLVAHANRPDITPYITIVVPARNEEATVGMVIEWKHSR